MRVLFAVAAGLLLSTAAFAVLDVENPGDSGPIGGGVPDALVPCADDIYCGDAAGTTTGFVADGEWNPSTNANGFMTTEGTLTLVDPICVGLGVILNLGGPSFDNSIPRGFCWDKDPANGKLWVGSWADASPPTTFVGIIHMDITGAEIASFAIPDPRTGMPIQPSGLAMDYSTGHMWAMLRNNPLGTNSAFMLLDTNVPDNVQPVVLFGPCDVAWGPAAPANVGSAGLEYLQEDCTIIALRQDSNSLGICELYKFQDLGATCPTQVGFCNIVNVPCTGAGPSVNRPWGVSVPVDPSFGPYAIYSDISLGVGCTGIGQPNDLHVVALPPVSGQCGTTAVEPTTWGKIKSDYR